MSLFGFVKDIGNRVFNKDEEAAEKIRDHIRDAGIGIKEFEVVFDMGIAGLSGEVNSKSDQDKAVLLAGNIAGVADVINNLKIADGADDEGEETEYYVIVAGDTLGKIAKRVYGDAMQYPKIFEANKEVIKDPDKIFVGQKIRLPK